MSQATLVSCLVFVECFYRSYYLCVIYFKAMLGILWLTTMVTSFQQKIMILHQATVLKTERELGGTTLVRGLTSMVSIWVQTRINGMVFNGDIGRTLMNV